MGPMLLGMVSSQANLANMSLRLQWMHLSASLMLQLEPTLDFISVSKLKIVN